MDTWIPVAWSIVMAIQFGLFTKSTSVGSATVTMVLFIEHIAAYFK